MKKYHAKGNYLPLGIVPSYRLEIPYGETAESCQEFACVLECITLLFKQHIPEVGTKPLTITIKHGDDYPQCRRDLQTVFLDTVPTEYSQIAYQYSHELCHYIIPADVTNELRWLEECICQAASLYFMHLLSLLWKKLNITITRENGDFIGQYFADYANNNALNFVSFDLTDPKELVYLQTHCYDRLKNRFVANKLMPIFIHYSETWKAVPTLCCIHEADLQQALAAWIQLAPASSQPGLQKIQELFQTTLQS